MTRKFIINLLGTILLFTTFPTLPIMPGGCVVDSVDFINSKECPSIDHVHPLPKKTKHSEVIKQSSRKNNSLFRSLFYSALHVASVYVGFHLAKNGGKVALTSYSLQHASETQKQKIEEEIIKNEMRNNGMMGIFKSTKLIEILKHPAAPIVSGVGCVTGVGLMLYGIRGTYRDIMSIFS